MGRFGWTIGACAGLALAACGGSGDAVDEAPPDATELDAAADADETTRDGGADAAAEAEASVDATPEAASDAADEPAPDAPAEAAADAASDGPLTASACFASAFASPPSGGPQYDQFLPVVGSHCLGTNHQDIAGIQRVVFLGDSITVGTPPSLPTDVYRAKLAAALAAKFHLQAPDLLWDSQDVIKGTSLTRESGDFASCAKWGARTDDLMKDNTQVADCIPPDKRDLRTLVVMTDGGNDIAAITKDLFDCKDATAVWDDVHSFVQLMRDTVTWLKDPQNMPGGADVVFGNMYEFTDGTGDTPSCPASGIAGLNGNCKDVPTLTQMVVWANEQYLKVAVDTQSDMIFLLESFCGHGFHNADPSAPCYRGPGTPQWFDLTCIHPNPAGHQVISDMFMAVVNE